MRGVHITIESPETKRPSKVAQLLVEAFCEMRQVKANSGIRHMAACVLDDLADRLNAETAGFAPGEFHTEELAAKET